jgi:type I restriction enzyme S subunit
MEEQIAAVRLLDWVHNRIARYFLAKQRLIASNDQTRATGRATLTRGLLADYRKRVVADAVTGRLDLRAAAAQLPEVIEEAEPFGHAESDAEAEQTVDSLTGNETLTRDN